VAPFGAARIGSLVGPLIPASILSEGARRTEDELVGWALRWRDAIAAAAPAPLVSLVMANEAEAVALLASLTAGDAAVILLPPEPAAWGTSPAVPDDTPLFLIPALGHLAPAAARIGMRPTVVPEIRPGTRDREPADNLALRSPGLVFQTSGSAGAPRPVYRTMAAVLAQGAALCQAHGMPRGAPILGMLPLARNHGLSRSLVPAALLGSPLGLLRAFHHRSALRMLRAEPYHYAAATPLAADVLSRCALERPPPRIPLFEVGAERLSDAVARAFAARFGAPARAAYGSTEMGTVTTDTAPSGGMRPATVGRALQGVEIRIGDDPRHPLAAGTPGPVWARTPWQMTGYGYPPKIQPAPAVGGFCPTEDVGALDDDGYLTLLGRSDECFKTAAGYLVSPLAIAATLAAHPGVRDAAVVPVSTDNGALIGALLEGEPLDLDEVRRHAAATLPPWSRPHVLVASAELPRLPGGKVDRTAARRRLDDAAGGRP